MNDTEVVEYVEIDTLRGYVFLTPRPEHLKLLEEERTKAGSKQSIRLLEIDAAGDENCFPAEWCDGSKSKGYLMVLNPKKIYAAGGSMRKVIKHEHGHIRFRHPDIIRFLGKLHPKLGRMYYKRVAEPQAVAYAEGTR